MFNLNECTLGSNQNARIRIQPASPKEIEEIGMLESLITSKKRFIRPGLDMKSSAQKEAMAPKQAAPATRIDKEIPAAQPNEETAPQFWYHTPIEDSTLVSKVAKQALNVQATLPIKDILSISPDI